MVWARLYTVHDIYLYINIFGDEQTFSKRALRAEYMMSSMIGAGLLNDATFFYSGAERELII